MFGYSYPGQTYPAGYPFLDGDVVLLDPDDYPISGVRWPPINDGGPWGYAMGSRWPIVNESGRWPAVSGTGWPSIYGSTGE